MAQSRRRISDWNADNAGKSSGSRCKPIAMAILTRDLIESHVELPERVGLARKKQQTKDLQPIQVEGRVF